MWKPRLPQGLLWDHNAHYHEWLLRQLPARVDRALDVGCGTGVLAGNLSDRANQVDAVDISAAMISRAESEYAHKPNVRWLACDLLDSDELDPGSYDAVTAVSSLHHMPLRLALTRIADLVRPGGVLAVVGMYQQATFTDHVVEIVALPANTAVGVVRAVRGRAGKPHDDGMPVEQPSTTLKELRRAAAELLPGARIRRRLFWRYSLVWRRPGQSH